MHPLESSCICTFCSCTYTHTHTHIHNMQHVFLLCYSLMSRDSFASVTSRWIPEIRSHLAEVPIVLCGNMLDLREDPEFCMRLQQKGVNPITTSEGVALANEINAYAYVECSAKTQKGIHEVFYKCVEAAINPKPRPKITVAATTKQQNAAGKRQPKKNPCIIL
eukprot:GEZU01017402.1.p1 GENE.GEZU01017402.1~~GEZU01017402.1.p1  ORF type:complete len:164 (-),score=19.61 GEZU01017402.1:271-762(-)